MEIFNKGYSSLINKIDNNNVNIEASSISDSIQDAFDYLFKIYIGMKERDINCFKYFIYSIYTILIINLQLNKRISRKTYLDEFEYARNKILEVKAYIELKKQQEIRENAKEIAKKIEDIMFGSATSYTRNDSN